MKRTIGHWQERLSYYRLLGSAEYTSYPELILKPDESDDSGRIISISIEDGNVVFNEKAVDAFCIEMSPDEAITALQEAIEWIREKSNG